MNRSSSSEAGSARTRVKPKKARTGKKSTKKKRPSKKPIDLTPPPSRVGGLEVHPAAVLPELGPEEQERMDRTVAKLGQVRPVVVRDGRILDGRGLARAVDKAGAEIRFHELPEGEDPLVYVLEVGLAGRRWTRSQLGLAAGRAANYKPGRPSKETVQGRTLSLDATAKLCGVSRRLAASARAVLKTGCAKLVRAVELNLVSLTRAEQIARLSAEEQEALLERVSQAGTAGERAQILARAARAKVEEQRSDDGSKSITALARIIRSADDAEEAFESLVDSLAREAGLRGAQSGPGGGEPA